MRKVDKDEIIITIESYGKTEVFTLKKQDDDDPEEVLGLSIIIEESVEKCIKELYGITEDVDEIV